MCESDNSSSLADDANLDDALDFLVVRLDDEFRERDADSGFEF
jgi:hypothetical protein